MMREKIIIKDHDCPETFGPGCDMVDSFLNSQDSEKIMPEDRIDLPFTITSDSENTALVVTTTKLDIQNKLKFTYRLMEFVENELKLANNGYKKG